MRRLRSSSVAGLAAAVFMACSVLAPSDAELTGGDGAHFDAATDGATPRDGATSDAALDGPVDGDSRDAALDSGDAGIDSGDAGPMPIPSPRLLLWLMADRGVVHNATSVWEWHDQSVNGRVARQSLAGSHPHLFETGLAGKPALHFDGEADWLSLPAGFSDFTQGASVFAVVQMASADACAAVVHLSNGAEVDDLSFGRTGAKVAYEVGPAYLESGPTGLPLNTPLLLGAIHSSDELMRTFVNGQYWAEMQGALPPRIQRSSNFIGRSLYDVCRPWEGLISELIVYGRALSENERAQVDGYLQNKWGCCGRGVDR